MEKIKIQFVIENISLQEVRNGSILDEETGGHYGRKYLITTKPFNYRGKEYSKLVIYANSCLDFQGVGLILSSDQQKELKKYMWELWWWEGTKDSYSPAVRVNETENKIVLTGGQLGQVEKVCFEGNSLTISPAENGSNWDEQRGRLEVKIKPIKVGEKMLINQLDFCVGKFFGDDVRQVIFSNFRPGKLVNIYFSEKRSLGPKIELENNQTKLVISPFDLKNEFRDYSWFSSVADTEKEMSPSPSSKKVSSDGKNDLLSFLLIFLYILIIVFIFSLVLQAIWKKKKKRTNS